jgi:uncharacterized protein (UPF0332 family)
VSSPSLARGHLEIAAARALLAAGHPSPAISRAYLADHHAATAALLATGELPATHTGVVSAFGRRVVTEGGLDHRVGRVLRRLLEDRDDVDFGLADAPPEVAANAVDRAAELVAATERWIAAHERAAAGRGAPDEA